jgi:hypothetical protein
MKKTHVGASVSETVILILAGEEAVVPPEVRQLLAASWRLESNMA